MARRASVATRRMRGRLLVLAALSVNLVAGLTLVPIDAAHADVAGDIRSAKAELSRLREQTESVAEQFNAARIQLRKAETDRASADAAAQRAKDQAAKSSRALASLAASMYRGGELAQITALVDSTADQYIQRSVMLNVIARQQNEMILNARTNFKRQSQAELAAADALKKQREILDGLNKRKASISAATDKQQRLLTKLAAKQRLLAAQARDAAARARAIALANDYSSQASRMGAGGFYSGATSAPTGSGGVATALQWARQQLGKPYVYGAAGPDTFDCSGLTQYVFGKGGIYLDHHTGSQWNAGRHVSRAELQPGDLVFFYSDLHHVGIYVGNGQMIDAPNSGSVVRQEAVWWDLYQGAVRLTG